ncbi:arylsulfotransferase family protein [Salegentibacter sp. JZCK2]|uniref:aryl-sulfate sulfotransferase n=1 Tax=Salegentibacter tibetensis TaxID=2873600 RepID=UPI001CCD3B82|nr:aryl-sulfate sulfotransferase [Salegentibacter tibetensis]MBZ9728466.1 arylsulfotransferase family protein [Salegentibacter tibetensis]
MDKKLKIRTLTSAVLFLVIFMIAGCSSDNNELFSEPDENNSTPEEPVDKEEGQEGQEGGGNEGSSEYEKAGKIEVFSPSLVNGGYLLVNDAGNNRVFLMNYDLDILHEWDLVAGIGNDSTLLPDGNLLTLLMDEDAIINFGGFGGLIQLLDKDSNILWEFPYSTEDYNLHHDIEMLPNGNILAMVWEKIPIQEAKESGVDTNTDIFPEKIIEIDPATNAIVWEWRSWDHIVQDFDSEKANYGVIADHPELIDINYVKDEKGDIMHGNGIAYDPDKDLIFLSINFYSEVWVIDHSTTTAEAKDSSGGNFNKGGDLVYRFGNPEAYQNPEGTRMFDRNHFPNLLNGEDTGSILVFNNNITAEQSILYELKLPAEYDLASNQNNELDVLWSFTSTNLFSPKVSGGVRLPNGNTLITEGDHGGWEVTNSGNVVWKFKGDGFYWRIYHYPQNAPELKLLEL